ncbi:MAG: radical SAM protein [Candidatus Hodarchaeales archaeon]|jgi:pyruvate formate lyase activating enzyme
MEYKDFEKCKLCAWECGIDRVAGEQGICMMGLPEVASCQLHPAPPQSYTVFLPSCNFRCLNCQNWEIAHYPKTNKKIKGIISPINIAEAGVKAIHSMIGQTIGADRFFFSGGSPTVSLPWVEEVVKQAKLQDPNVKVNFDTNGFPSKKSFKRILAFSDSITFDIKAYHDEVHRALTGAPVEPVLRNAEVMAKHRNRLWEFRILVIPSIIDLPEIEAIAEFIVDLDETLPTCLLTFRPNFCLDSHPGASRKLMEKAVMTAKKCGLKQVTWAGFPDIRGKESAVPFPLKKKFIHEQSAYAAFHAQRTGCKRIHRDCGVCNIQILCDLKSYTPLRTT